MKAEILLEILEERAADQNRDERFWSALENRAVNEDRHIDPVFVPSDRV